MWLPSNKIICIKTATLACRHYLHEKCLFTSIKAFYDLPQCPVGRTHLLEQSTETARREQDDVDISDREREWRKRQRIQRDNQQKSQNEMQQMSNRNSQGRRPQQPNRNGVNNTRNRNQQNDNYGVTQINDALRASNGRQRPCVPSTPTSSDWVVPFRSIGCEEMLGCLQEARMAEDQREIERS